MWYNKAMATTPTLPIPVILDPVSADIQAICGAIESIMKFLATEEGQLFLKNSRENSAKFLENFGKFGDFFGKLFHLDLPKVG